MKAGNAKNSVASVCVSNYNKLGAVFIFVKEGKIMQEKEKGGFSFINEQIKEKPLNKKRLVKKALFTVALAVISVSYTHLLAEISGDKQGFAA